MRETTNDESHKNACNHCRGESKEQPSRCVQSNCAAETIRQKNKIKVGSPPHDNGITCFEMLLKIFC